MVCNDVALSLSFLFIIIIISLISNVWFLTLLDLTCMVVFPSSFLMRRSMLNISLNFEVPFSYTLEDKQRISTVIYFQ